MSNETYEPYEPYETEPAPADGPSGLHPVNIGHLVMGVAFAVMLTGWALLESGLIEPEDLRWMMPVPWLAAGAAGLAALLLRRSPE